MFVKLIKAGTLALTAALLAASASAGEIKTTLDVTLQNLQPSEGKLYLSIQKEDEFMQERGTSGGIYEIDTTNDRTFSYDLPMGTYAVSIWHDIDNDGEFSMNERWIPTDGWAMSGDTLTNKKPTFEEAKINVGKDGAAVTIPIIYYK